MTLPWSRCRGRACPATAVATPPQKGPMARGRLAGGARRAAACRGACPCRCLCIEGENTVDLLMGIAAAAIPCPAWAACLCKVPAGAEDRSAAVAALYTAHARRGAQPRTPPLTFPDVCSAIPPAGTAVSRCTVKYVRRDSGGQRGAAGGWAGRLLSVRHERGQGGQTDRRRRAHGQRRQSLSGR